jgi:hypothetical protein
VWVKPAEKITIPYAGGFTESTVSNGIVSAIRPNPKGGRFLQITTPISPGSSGGPLFNVEGQVIGVTTMYLKGGENLNFAIPINEVERVIKWVNENPSRPGEALSLPNEPEEAELPPDATCGDGHTPCERGPGGPARAYFQQLYAAGGLPKMRAFVCFNDDKSSSHFLTFGAFRYDEKDAYGPSLDKDQPYVFSLPAVALGVMEPSSQEFFRQGGRVLEMDWYSKGVKTDGTQEYHWDGNSWVHRYTTQSPFGPEADIYTLFIEPVTMRYRLVLALVINSDNHVPPSVGDVESGTCELIPSRH